MSDLTPDTLAAIGRALYGEEWVSALCSDLDVGIRSMRRWVKGEIAVPAGVVQELRVLIEERHRVCCELLLKIHEEITEHP